MSIRHACGTQIYLQEKHSLTPKINLENIHTPLKADPPGCPLVPQCRAVMTGYLDYDPRSTPFTVTPGYLSTLSLKLFFVFVRKKKEHMHDFALGSNKFHLPSMVKC